MMEFITKINYYLKFLIIINLEIILFWGKLIITKIIK